MNQLKPKPRIPHVYPNGLPLYWRDETSGELRAAVLAYLNRFDGPQPAPAPTHDQLALLVTWLDHYIHAPCWRDAGASGDLAKLRERVKGLTNCDEISQWLRDALEIGLDPL